MKIFVVNSCYDDFSTVGNNPILGFSNKKKANKFLKDVEAIAKMNEEAFEEAKKVTEKEFNIKQGRGDYYFEDAKAQKSYLEHFERLRTSPKGMEKAFALYKYRLPPEGFSISELEVEID